jgi:hypothetical protein
MNCKKCRVEITEEEAKKTDVTFKNGTQHIEARCPHCNSYLKYLAHDHEGNPLEILPFGKYAGRTCMSIACEDYNYAYWYIENGKGRYVKDFEVALQSLGNDIRKSDAYEVKIEE